MCDICLVSLGQKVTRCVIAHRPSRFVSRCAHDEQHEPPRALEVAIRHVRDELVVLLEDGGLLEDVGQPEQDERQERLDLVGFEVL